MSSMAPENLSDVLQPLSRWTLDTVQFSNRRFQRMITNGMSNVCLRQVESAEFWAEDTRQWYNIHVSGLPALREHRNGGGDYTDFFLAFLNALRSSRVAGLALFGVTFTPALAALVLEAPITAPHLCFDRCTFVALTPMEFHELVWHFSSTSLKLSSTHHGAGHITDEFLRELSKKGVRRIAFPRMSADGGSCYVTDDAIVEFCLQPDVPFGQYVCAPSKWEPYGALQLDSAHFTKNLLKRLVEALGTASLRTQPLKITGVSARVDYEGLLDFAQYLSYRDRGFNDELLIYDFSDEQNGEGAAMHLQIAFRPSASYLQIVRARRPDPLFYEPDE